ncbi:MAG TPA: hypothetical protein VNI36_05545 [Candidatus Dormibacteraeota bacterium]|nr:hypothetical protein [Candidatus Dormibacteraeota bacterium]
MATLDLRPLSLGELLDRTFFLYRRNFFLFAGLAAIPYSLFLMIQLSNTLISRLAISSPGTSVSYRLASPAIRFSIAGGGVLALAMIVAGSIALVFSLGATVFAVSEIYAGRRTSIRDCLLGVRGKAGTIFGVLFLSGLILFGGLILLVIPAIYFACRICVATPAALLEDLDASESIRRSSALTKGFAGRAFMIYMLYFALTWIVLAAFQVPFVILMAANARQPQMVILWLVFMQVANFLGTVLVTPIGMIGFSLFYYDLRVRKEGFDLQLMMQAIGGDPVPPRITGGTPSMFGRDAF